MVDLIYRPKYKMELKFQLFNKNNWTKQEEERNERLTDLGLFYRICHIDPGRIGYIIVRRKQKKPLVYDNFDNVIRAQEHIMTNCDLEMRSNDYSDQARHTCSLAKRRYDVLINEEAILLKQMKELYFRLDLLQSHILANYEHHDEWLYEQLEKIDSGLKIFAPSPFIDNAYSCSTKWQLAKKEIRKKRYIKAKQLANEAIAKIKIYKYLEPRIN